jgi:hypothetical protein
VAIGLADAVRAPGRPGIQGIASDLSDILLRGESWKAQLGDALLDAILTRTISGASTLKLEVNDPRRRLLNHPLLEAKYDLELDGLKFRYKGVEQTGRLAPLVLTHEALVVALLRELTGPHKAYRDKVTRAQFAKALVREVKHPVIPFICPELDVIQPIETEKQARDAVAEADTKRGKGIGKATHLQVKEGDADPSQVEAGERALKTAESHGANDRVMAAVMVALIVESEIGKTSSNWLQQIGSTAASAGGSPTNLEASVVAFLNGYGYGSGGAIAYERAHPGAKVYEIAQAVQASGAGLASNGAANYGPWVNQAWEWVETYGGGAGSVSTLETLRYAFEEKKNEDNWRCDTRLAKEVNWRCFESAGAIYFIDELDLLRSRLRMVIGDSTPGVEDTAPKFDEGKPVTEFRVQVRARSWAAPPGSVAQVKQHGPCNGLWIVSKIESRLRKKNSVCDVTLKRPTKPLPEPAPETKTRSIGFGGGGSTVGGELGVLEGTPKEIVDRVVVYAHRTYGFAVSPATVKAANATHGPTVDGGRSDHQGPPDQAWAADISNGTMTPEERKLAEDIAEAFDIPWQMGDLATVTHGGYQLQLIHGCSDCGGDHTDHVHFGVHLA